MGVGYQLTPLLNLGAHYFRTELKGDANLNGSTTAGPKSRNGYTIGLRHRF